MSRRRSTIVLLALVAALASVLGARSIWFGVGSNDERADARRASSAPDALTAPNAEGSVDGAASLATHATAPTVLAPSLPAPVDFSNVDRERDLFGTVVYTDGQGVAGAELKTVTYPFQRATIITYGRRNEAVVGPGVRTARDGSFAIRLPRGAKVSLRVTASGVAPVERPDCHAGERVRIVVKPGVALVIEAVDEVGKPAAGAAFALHSRSAEVEFAPRATTGPDGRARMEDLPPSISTWLESDGPPFGGIGGKIVELPETGEKTLRVELTSGRTITGRVSDAETSAPIAGARVGTKWSLHRAVVADADGRYAIRGWTDGGAEVLDVGADGYGRDETVVGSSTVVDFALSKGDSVAGRIVAPDGAPIANATIGVVGRTRRNGRQLVSVGDALSGVDGRFSVSGLRRDLPHTLVVMPAGFGRTLVDFDPRIGGAGVIDVGDVVVAAARMVSGRVIAADGSPGPRARLTLHGANADRGRLRSSDASALDFDYGSEEVRRSDDLGRFQFPDLAPGTYRVSMTAEGAPDQERSVVVAADTDPEFVEFRLPAGRSFKIAVVDEAGKPVPWARVLLVGDDFGTSVRLDPNAAATISLAEGAHALNVRAFSFLSGDDERRFLLPDHDFPIDPTKGELRVVLQSAATIRGRVVGPDGAGLARAALSAFEGAAEVADEFTDNDGKFEIDVPRRGPFTLRLQGSRLGVPNRRVEASGLTGDVNDVAADAHDVVLHARPVKLSQRQSLLVLDPDGHPVGGAQVSTRWAGGSVSSESATTDGAGRAELENLPDLPCAWNASEPKGSTGLMGAKSPTSMPTPTVVELRLRRAAKLRGRVAAPAGAAFPLLVRMMQIRGGRKTRLVADVMDPHAPNFEFTLDPDDGETVTLIATAGPGSAPTHRARVSGVRIDASEVVLSLEDVR